MGLDQSVIEAGKKKETAEEPAKKPDAPAKPEKAAPTEKPVALPKGFRDELEKTKAELKAKSDSAAKLEARIAEMEARGQDTTALTERLAQREKELEEIKGELYLAKSEVSPEFTEKWDKPFEKAAEYARNVIERLQVGAIVEIDDPNTGEKRREWRPTEKANWEKHFVRLYHLAQDDPAGALEQAEYFFGKGAPIVVQQLNELTRRDYERSMAREEEKKTWKEKVNAKQAEQIKEREAFQSASSKARADMLAKYADWYDEDPNDTEGNEILKKSRELINRQPRTFQERVSLMTRIRLDAESAVRERYRNQKLKAEVEELKSELEKYKGSKPGMGNRPSTDGGAGGGKDNVLDELDEILGGKL